MSTTALTAAGPTVSDRTPVRWNADASLVRDLAAFACGQAGASLRTLTRLAGVDRAEAERLLAMEPWLRPLRRARASVMYVANPEQDPAATLATLKLLRAYFARSHIVAAVPRTGEPRSGWRLRARACTATDKEGLRRAVARAGGVDLVIDAGPRLCGYQIRAFEILFPLLNPGGLYFAEGTAGSHCADLGGGPVGTEAYERSSVRYFQRLSDGFDAAGLRALHPKTAQLSKAVASVAIGRNRVVIAKQRAV